MTKKLKVLIVGAELTPMAKVGGLADVMGSLPKGLQKIGVDARIAIPNYGIIDPKKYPKKLVAKNIKTEFDGQIEKFNVYQTNLPSKLAKKVPVYLIDHKKYLGGGSVYVSADASSNSSSTEAHRFTFFTKTILKMFEKINWTPDILHCHDWHVSLLPLFNMLSDKPLPTLLTIHNLAYQGNYANDMILKLLGQDLTVIDSFKKRLTNFNYLNCLEQGIINSDLINTVSPNYAKEILTKEFGCGLEKVLIKRKSDLSGILNGLDLEHFNPQTDEDLIANFSVSKLKGKKKCKADLQKEFGLEVNEKIPLIGMVSRLAEQKGLDIIIPAMKKLIKEKAQFVFLGTGDKKYEEELQKFDKEKNVTVKIMFDAALAQKIYGGSDMFLIPSRFEPCGLGQMISMRFGSLPIARATGGLADTVFELTKTKGNGFIFNKYDEATFIKTVRKAIKIYSNDKKVWNNGVKRAMKQNFSWDLSAQKYLKLYQKLIK